MKKEIARNKKLRHNYEIIKRFEAGVVLKGTEIKSIRSNGATITEAYIDEKRGELYLKNSYIAPYKHGNIHNHDERRDRKLLLHGKEMKEIRKSIDEKGLTCVPLLLYFKNDYVKLEIAVAKGKKLHDKRSAIKERETKREIAAKVDI